MGLVMLGTCSTKAVEEMLQYAQETQHEKIIRGLAIGISLIMYGAEEEADILIEKLCQDKVIFFFHYFFRFSLFIFPSFIRIQFFVMEECIQLQWLMQEQQIIKFDDYYSKYLISIKNLINKLNRQLENYYTLQSQM